MDMLRHVDPRLLAALLLPVLLGACAGGPHGVVRGDDPAFIPVAPAAPVPPEHNNGAIFQVSQNGGLFSDDKAHRVGDILTVRLAERTQARKSANTSSSKESSVEIPSPTIFGGGVTVNGRPVLNNAIDGTRSFGGRGDSAQSNQLDGNITVTVAEVLSNGNLVIQGEKWIRINQGEEYIRLQGVVRPVDIRADNTVLSTQIANAQVAYGGSGTLADSNSPGWLTRFFNSPIWPF
ncbi:flagellar basal body L-ring protein FlgH [Thioalkalivibrio sp.]|uniref:flagellar basal body L-ring protein FlgH n=1 Tax=Thioalkalivibrio sp. TaxID=2093813 RepID=UPI0012D607F6|nr:flagellar basal body L-ring protein FlgH [Thioalkalivibrio sp.]TVP82156.1 MAG: flagellar basal body L-ring protein FlgH [Thioalkalivibrio sp.]